MNELGRSISSREKSSLQGIQRDFEGKKVSSSLLFSFRGGGHENVTDPSQVELKVRQLVSDLCDEQFSRPDYEHADVYISHPNGWSVSASMNGEVSLEYFPTNVQPTRYQYGLSKDELVHLFVMLAEDQMEEIHAMNWHNGPVHGKGDHYLFLDRSDMTDLHRAAAKGDCEWITTELAAHADIDAKDRDGVTALHCAAIAGRIEVCRLLIAVGANLECKDINGSSIVDYAALSCEYLDSAQVCKLKEMLQQGRAGPTVRHKFQLVLQLPCSTRRDFDDLLAIEESLLECFRQTSHALDGHDCTVGTGTMNIFLYTDDPVAALAMAMQSIDAGKFPRYKAAFRSLNANDYKWLWPPDCRERFRLF